MSQTPKISVSALSKSFGAKQVLNGISLDVANGESLVIIGGSGTGKSVLLKCILGLMTPDAGQVMIDGEDTTHLSASEREALMRKFGMLFQGGALFDSLPVWENITFSTRRLQKLSKAEAEALAISKLDQVGLKRDVAYLNPSELSGGMQKRVSLARAICGNPDIIFFDEPTTGLDPIMSGVINELIIKCCKDIGATAITITHDMTSAKAIADRIAMIYEGTILWQGTPQEVMTTDHAHVRQFVSGAATGPIAVGNR
jgi:phospholipid/cholesterol/gamma-HCH transport system ATP-binding protein